MSISSAGTRRKSTNRDWPQRVLCRDHPRRTHQALASTIPRGSRRQARPQSAKRGWCVEALHQARSRAVDQKGTGPQSGVAPPRVSAARVAAEERRAARVAGAAADRRPERWDVDTKPRERSS